MCGRSKATIGGRRDCAYFKRCSRRLPLSQMQPTAAKPTIVRVSHVLATEPQQMKLCPERTSIIRLLRKRGRTFRRSDGLCIFWGHTLESIRNGLYHSSARPASHNMHRNHGIDREGAVDAHVHIQYVTGSKTCCSDTASFFVRLDVMGRSHVGIFKETDSAKG